MIQLITQNEPSNLFGMIFGMHVNLSMLDLLTSRKKSNSILFFKIYLGSCELLTAVYMIKIPSNLDSHLEHSSFIKWVPVEVVVGGR